MRFLPGCCWCNGPPTCILWDSATDCDINDWTPSAGSWTASGSPACAVASTGAGTILNNRIEGSSYSVQWKGESDHFFIGTASDHVKGEVVTGGGQITVRLRDDAGTLLTEIPYTDPGSPVKWYRMCVYIGITNAFVAFAIEHDNGFIDGAFAKLPSTAAAARWGMKPDAAASYSSIQVIKDDPANCENCDVGQDLCIECGDSPAPPTLKCTISGAAADTNPFNNDKCDDCLDINGDEFLVDWVDPPPGGTCTWEGYFEDVHCFSEPFLSNLNGPLDLDLKIRRYSQLGTTYWRCEMTWYNSLGVQVGATITDDEIAGDEDDCIDDLPTFTTTVAVPGCDNTNTQVVVELG